MSHRREGLISRVLPAAIIAAGCFMVSEAIKSCGQGGPVAVTAGATVEQIKVSDAIPLIDVGGSASGSSHTYNTLPIVGWKIPESEVDITTTVNGIVEMRTDQSGVKFGTYNIPDTKNNTSTTQKKSNLGIKATVDTSHIYMRPSMSQLYQDGVPQEELHRGSLSYLTAEKLLKIEHLADAAGKLHYIASCGRAVLPTLEAGVQNYTRKSVANAANIPAKLKGGEQAANMMREMVQKPIKVVFTQPASLPSGHVIQQELSDPHQIKLRYQNVSIEHSPIQPIPDEKTALDNLLKDKDGKRAHDYKNVTVTGDKPCTFTGQAANQLNNLSGAGTVTSAPAQGL